MSKWSGHCGSTATGMDKRSENSSQRLYVREGNHAWEADSMESSFDTV